MSPFREGISRETLEEEVKAAVNHVYSSGIQNMVASVGKDTHHSNSSPLLNCLQNTWMQGVGVGVSCVDSNINSGGGSGDESCMEYGMGNLNPGKFSSFKT